MLSHELIGLTTKIQNSSNTQIIGLTGKVIDETKSMLILETKNGVKTVPKKVCDWEFFLDDVNFIVSGKKIEKRPYERLVTRK